MTSSKDIALSRGLGFYPGSTDERDYRLSTFITPLRAPKTRGSYFWQSGKEVLDQGSSSACVGFSWCQRTNSAPKIAHYDNQFALDLYHRAQELDEWSGTDYEGTSVRAGGLAAIERHLIRGFAYAADAEEAAIWLLNKGPIVIGVNWRSGADRPDPNNNYYINPLEGNVRGGHAIECDGIRWVNGGGKGDYFRLKQSWSAAWGLNGRCRVAAEDFATWLSEQYATIATAVEV